MSEQQTNSFLGLEVLSYDWMPKNQIGLTNGKDMELMNMEQQIEQLKQDFADYKINAERELDKPTIEEVSELLLVKIKEVLNTNDSYQYLMVKTLAETYGELQPFIR